MNIKNCILSLIGQFLPLSKSLCLTWALESDRHRVEAASPLPVIKPSRLFTSCADVDVDSVLPQVNRLVENLACANEPIGWHPAVVQERGAVGGEKQPSLMIMIPGQMISAPHHHTTPQHNQTHSRQRQALDLELLSGYDSGSPIRTVSFKISSAAVQKIWLQIWRF